MEQTGYQDISGDQRKPRRTMNASGQQHCRAFLMDPNAVDAMVVVPQKGETRAEACARAKWAF